MLTFGDNTVVSDFGLARNTTRDDSRLTRTTAIIGTEEYLAPEQRGRGSRATDQRTDIYMLGRSLYELLTGDSPSLVNDHAIAPGIAEVILKATNESPARRYASVREFADAVREYRRTLAT
ncbi:MAG: hypothetical protein RLZZ450_5394 [Pseudomonadota bacterium]|jgi:serine/threonine protein kinase